MIRVVIVNHNYGRINLYDQCSTLKKGAVETVPECIN